jgi:hypothetical protein
MIPAAAKPYVALAVAAGLSLGGAGLFFAGWYVNGLRHERNALEADANATADLNNKLEAERKRADGYSQQVIDLLERAPQATNTVREIVRANPSPCMRPGPVTDGLSLALASANQAITASIRDGVLPPDADQAQQSDGRR